MINLHRAWHYWLAEPFTWICYTFFQPQRFARETEREFEILYSRFSQRVVSILRLIIPLFLVCYSLALASQVALIPFHLLSPDPFRLLLAIPGGIACGIIIGFAVGLALGFAVGFIADLAFGIAVGLAFGFAAGIAAGLTDSFAAEIAAGLAFGLAFGLATGLATSLATGLVLGLAFGFIGGLIFGLPFGFISGLTVGLVWGLAYMAGYFRLPLFLASGPSAFRAYRYSHQNPPRVFDYLHRSSLYWDERVYLPLPFLKQTLLIGYYEAPKKVMEEIAFITAERPQQLRAARAVVLEIAMRDLEGRRTLEQIAGATQRIAELLSSETKLIDPRWILPVARLSDAGRDAMQAIAPIGLQGQRKALNSLQTNLRKIYPNAFRDQLLNARLAQVVSRWQEIACLEQERLDRAAQDAGSIDNPYKPGQFLPLKDSLFVGRRSLAKELEGALSLESRRPTFLLNGERRMGKTSALQQLPYLLGSQYISVFYNLQQPGMYASVATFLGELANGIHREMNVRGMAVRELAYSALREIRRANDASSYRSFDNWLAGIEGMLEHERRTLLLAFDEFEFLEEATQSQRLDLPLLLNWMRTIIQFHPHVALLFSGMKTFAEMGSQTGIDWTNYFINVQSLRVSFLQPDEARHLIIKPTSNYPGEKIFLRDVVEMIIAETHCHPFLLQAVCSALITQLNVDRRERAGPGDIEQVIEKVLEGWGSHFHNLWNRSDHEQRACLIVLLKQNHADAQWLAQKTGLSETIIRSTLQRLLQRDLVLRKQDGAYCIAVPMFRRWLERNA
jgi:uncharacterized protein